MAQENNNPDTIEPRGDAPRIPELDKYIFEADPYTSGVVPRKLKAAEVARYLEHKVKRDIALKSVNRVVDVVRFYETVESVKFFRSLLDGKESGEDAVRRSAAFASIVAILGDADDIEFVRQYYRTLVRRAQSVAAFEDLIALHEAAGLGEASTDLKQIFEAKAAALESKKETDFGARIEYQKFNEELAQKLFRASRVKSVKDGVLSISDRHKRIREEIKIYLSLEYGFLEYLQPWAASRLRRETWGTIPSEQVNRGEKPELKENLVSELRAALKDLSSIPGYVREDDESLRLRLLRAIKFFGGTLSDEEDGELRIGKGKQFDLLADEGFGLD
ncbi:MAG TPA: hypothetical protein PKO33_13520 [Pyrinomonadaceae bacterium]|nr:hypothetical protein [Pyrinomonadaceae bacterium]